MGYDTILINEIQGAGGTAWEFLRIVFIDLKEWLHSFFIAIAKYLRPGNL